MIGAAYTHIRPEFVREEYAYLCDSVVMPLMRLLDGERAHEMAIWAASKGLAPKVRGNKMPLCVVESRHKNDPDNLFII